MPQTSDPSRPWFLGWLGIEPPWSKERRARLELVKLGMAASPPATAALGVLILVQAALTLGSYIAHGFLVGSVTAAIREGGSPDRANSVGLALVVTGAIYVTRAAAPSVASDLAIWISSRADHLLRLRLMSRMSEPIGIAHLEDADIQDDVSRAGAIAQFSPGSAIHGMADVLTMRISSLGSFIVVATFRLWLAVVLLVGYQVLEVHARRRFMEVARVVYGRTKDFRRSEYVRSLALGEAAKETRVFGMKDWIVDRYRTSWLTAMTEVWRDRRRATIKQSWGAPVQALLAVGAYWVIAQAVLRGEIDLGRATVLIGAVAGVAGFLSLGMHRTRIEYGVTAYLPLLALDEKIDTLSPIRRSPGKDPAGMPREGIRFESVGFRYEGRETDVYTGLDLEIPAGQSLAIVGVNGAGKTTLCKLLARCYEPTAGRITVDGIDLRDLDAAAWQRRVGAVFQDFVGFVASARDNVGFGCVERLHDQEAIEAAARRAGILGQIEELPAGWDSILQRAFENGAELSGGQWQRVALARALFAVECGAGVLVLDEPTASLDVRGEAELFDRYLELTRGVTSILVSHRFSTVRHADRICVLDGGRVTESGSHDELVALGGTYAQMFTLQASRFADAGEATTSA